MKNNLTRILAIAALVTGAVFAQQAPPAQRGARMHQRMQQMVQTLNLTADQQAQAKDIFAAARTSAQPLRQQMRDARKQLKTDARTGAPQEVIVKDSNAVGGLVSQITAIRTEAFQKFYSTLTPDQKAKLDDLASKRGARFRRQG